MTIIFFISYLIVLKGVPYFYVPGFSTKHNFNWYNKKFYTGGAFATLKTVSANLG